jgi:uncharacterized protein (DUF1501 family)
MLRRKFLSNFGIALGSGVILNGIPLNALARLPILSGKPDLLEDSNRVYVLIQLSGGNDGLNTVIPLDQYSTYKSLRTNIAIPESAVLKLNDNTGLHPAMSSLKVLFDEGKAAVVQSVSYPNPNFSHFRATDIWNTASSYDQYLTSGWLGRYLNLVFPGYPDSYPTQSMPDPLAIQIGAITSLAFQGTSKNMAIAITNPDTFYQLVNNGTGGSDTDVPNTFAGTELKFVRSIELKSQQYANSIKTAAGKGKNLATYPTSNSLADQLKIVARLIAGGLLTKIYYVTLGGFDLHSNQVLTSDTTQGAHSILLKRLSEAVSAFQDDLKQLSIDSRVISMTYSEFGRRVASNTSIGTDHGTAEPVFIIGNEVSSGVLGNNPNLSDLTNGNLKMQFDYRQIYKSILQQWFKVSDQDLPNILTGSFQALPVIKTSQGVHENNSTIAESFILYQNYPNPFNGSTVIEFEIKNDSHVNLKLFDIKGNEIMTMIDEFKSKGLYKINFNASRLASGNYIYQLRAGALKKTKQMILLK